MVVKRLKLHMDTNLISPITIHNHGLGEYQSAAYKLKSKCKIKARNSQDSLRKMFDDITREDTVGSVSHLANVNLPCIAPEECYSLRFQ